MLWQRFVYVLSGTLNRTTEFSPMLSVEFNSFDSMNSCIESQSSFPKWAKLSVNSANWGNLLNHWSMNWNQFKDPVSNLCLAGAVVASWSLTQEVAGSSPFTVITNILVTNFAKFTETSKKNFNVLPFNQTKCWNCSKFMLRWYVRKFSKFNENRPLL